MAGAEDVKHATVRSSNSKNWNIISGEMLEPSHYLLTELSDISDEKRLIV